MGSGMVLCTAHPPNPNWNYQLSSSGDTMWRQVSTHGYLCCSVLSTGHQTVIPEEGMVIEENAPPTPLSCT